MYSQQQQQTIEDLSKKLQQLAAQVAELAAWKAEKENQQIAYPLDRASTQVISRELGL